MDTYIYYTTDGRATRSSATLEAVLLPATTESEVFVIGIPDRCSTCFVPNADDPEHFHIYFLHDAYAYRCFRYVKEERKLEKVDMGTAFEAASAVIAEADDLVGMVYSVAINKENFI